MRFEGEAIKLPVLLVTIEGGELIAPPRTRIGGSLTMLMLPEGVEVSGWRLTHELLAEGLEMAGGGKQIGRCLYVRNMTGAMVECQRLGSVTVVPPRPTLLDAPREDEAIEPIPKAASRARGKKSG